MVRDSKGQDYGQVFNTYPIYSRDNGFEGAIHRFTTLPTPSDVAQLAMLGVPRTLPLTNEYITDAFFETYLSSAINEIEMSMGMDITPTEHDEPFDYVDGMFTANYTGIKLSRWPAVKIVSMQMKFPHAVSTSPYQTYTIPAPWVALRRGNVNVMAAFGSVSVNVNNSNAVSSGGLFAYITGFARGVYQPGIIEVTYVAGFENDKVPAIIADLVKTLAALRALGDLASVMFPYGSVSVAIDGVSQSSSLPVAQLIAKRVENLEMKVKSLQNAITSQHGRKIKIAYLGA